VTHAIGQERTDVVIREPVIDHPTGPAASDDTTVPEQSELVAQGGLADTQQEGEIAYAELVLGRAEGMDDASTGRIGQRREDRGDSVRVRAAEDASKQGGDPLRVDALDGASVRGQRQNI
jgi:hypothetical protein